MIVIVALAVITGQPPTATIVFVIVYVPGVLAFTLITPVEASNDNPVVEEKVPATPPPLNTGVGVAPEAAQ